MSELCLEVPPEYTDRLHHLENKKNFGVGGGG